MHESELYTANARDHAELAEYWARQAKRSANSIDFPAMLMITIAINLLILCVALTLIQLENPYDQCQRQRNTQTDHRNGSLIR